MRRSRLDVLCSFLAALEYNSLRQTPLMYKTNLPHELFTKYLRELERSGLIEKSRTSHAVRFSITAEGRTYLREYRRFLKFSANFGL